MEGLQILFFFQVLVEGFQTLFFKHWSAQRVWIGHSGNVPSGHLVTCRAGTVGVSRHSAKQATLCRGATVKVAAAVQVVERAL